MLHFLGERSEKQPQKDGSKSVSTRYSVSRVYHCRAELYPTWYFWREYPTTPGSWKVSATTVLLFRRRSSVINRRIAQFTLWHVVSAMRMSFFERTSLGDEGSFFETVGESHVN